jgi:hypothetical protein
MRAAQHVPDSEPKRRDTGAGAHTAMTAVTPEVGAVCGKSARTDLGGGREVTRVPTATTQLTLDDEAWPVPPPSSYAPYRGLLGEHGIFTVRLNALSPYCVTRRRPQHSNDRGLR